MTAKAGCTLRARVRVGLRARAWLITAGLLAPALVFLALAFLGPLGVLFQLSISSPEGALAAYEEILGSGVYRQVFLNTLVLSFWVAALAVLLSYPTAYMLSRLSGLAAAIGFWCVLLPLWISVLVRTFAWILLLERNGPVNRLLVGSGLTDQPIAILFESPAVYIGMVHVLLPYALLPIYASMRGVDERLLQASEVLGATPFKTFVRVYLPLTLPGVAAGFLLVFLLALGFYVTPAMLGSMRNLTVAMLIDVFVNEQLIWPLAAAAAFCLLTVVLLLLGVASRFVNVTSTVTVR